MKVHGENNRGIMKKVVKVTETEMVLDDGSTVELLFELDKPLTLEEAQKIYEQSLRVGRGLSCSRCK